MEEKIKISCSIGTTDGSATLGVEVWISDQQIFNSDHVTDTVKVEYEMPDNDSEHELKFILKNKTSDHTKIDDNGDIVQDARLTIGDVEFDEIKLGQVFIDQAVYTHNFNGTQPEIQDKFYGEMGCNGVVTMKFSTPV